MRALPELRRKLEGWWRRDAIDEELREELRTHLEMKAADVGSTRAARQAFGNPNVILADARDAWGWPRLETLWQDLRYASRMLRRQPAFTLAALATLTLGIGATTAMFTVVSETLLRVLPYPHADRLVQVSRSYDGELGNSVSPVKFLHWRRETRGVFTDLAAYTNWGIGFTLVDDREPERLTGALVSAAFFEVMGVPPALGRGFREDEDIPGHARVAVLSHSLWTGRFGADPAIVGKALSLNGEPHTVVGVMPAGFEYPDGARLWSLFRFDPASQDRAHNFDVVGRLRPEIALPQAHAAMALAAASLRQSNPDLVDERESAGVRPLRDRLYGDMRRPLLILLAAAGCVLLIACVNVSSLQMAQAALRRHEIALRIALGAGTGRVVRHLLVESVLLAGIGGLAGTVLAMLAVPALLALSPVHIPFVDHVGIDWRVLAFAASASIAAGFAFGVLPAWQSARPDLDRVLRSGSRRTVGLASRWTRRLLVGSQVALALVLTVCAFLLVKSLTRLQTTPTGFVADRVLTAKVALPEARYGSGLGLAQFQEQTEQRLASLPGVRAASIAALLPLQVDSDMVFTIEGRYIPGTRTGVGWAQHRVNGPGYFEALQIPLRRGRLFTNQDRAHTPSVIVINQAAADRFWPDSDPIGQRITLGQPDLPSLAEPRARESSASSATSATSRSGRLPNRRSTRRCLSNTMPGRRWRSGCSRSRWSCAPMRARATWRDRFSRPCGPPIPTCPTATSACSTRSSPGRSALSAST